jgi:hypothetical protein
MIINPILEPTSLGIREIRGRCGGDINGCTFCKNRAMRSRDRGWQTWLPVDVWIVTVQIGVTSALLEEVVVTARKREEPIQQVPISISAFSSDQIDVLKVRSLMDLSVWMPNVVMDDVWGYREKGIGRINHLFPKSRSTEDLEVGFNSARNIDSTAKYRSSWFGRNSFSWKNDGFLYSGQTETIPPS